MELDVVNDFDAMVDGLAEVMLRRRGNTTTVEGITARWRSAEHREAEPSAGVAVEADAVWELVFMDDAEPHVGDVVIDGEDRQWTVLVAEHLPLLSRWRCETRELRIAYGCGERIDVERPVWSEAETPEIVGWNYVATALPVRIQPWEVSAEESTAGEATHRIILGESLALKPNDRFVAADGTVYHLRSYLQAERIDALPVAMVVRG